MMENPFDEMISITSADIDAIAAFGISVEEAGKGIVDFFSNPEVLKALAPLMAMLEARVQEMNAALELLNQVPDWREAMYDEDTAVGYALNSLWLWGMRMRVQCGSIEDEDES